MRGREAVGRAGIRRKAGCAESGPAHAADIMVATAKRFTARTPVRPEDAAEERALMKLNRMFAKAAPIAARRRKQAMQRFQRELDAEIRRAS